MNWYEQQLQQGWLKKKRVPKGDAPLALMAGVAYRTPLNDMGHILGAEELQRDDRVFLCGRSVDLRGWYLANGADARWGPEWYILPDTRKGNKCSICATRWKNGQALRDRNARLARADSLNSPITQAEWEAKRGQTWEKEMKQLTIHAEWVASLLGGEVIDEDAG